MTARPWRAVAVAALVCIASACSSGSSSTAISAAEAGPLPAVTGASTAGAASGAPASDPTPAAHVPTAVSESVAPTAPAQPPRGLSGTAVSSACGLADAAFCETFDGPHDGGTQTGQLDPVLWGVSRLGDFNPSGINNGLVDSHNACAGGAATPAPADVQICNGQMVESVNDGGAVAQLNTYPKQPFDFTGRTGTVVFDVSADSQGTHAAWPEFVITDEPVPGVRRSISFIKPPHAVNQIGFSIDGGCAGRPGTQGVGVVFTAVDGVYAEQQGERPDCITVGSATAMNHFEVQVSQTHIAVYGSDAGSTELKLLASEDVQLSFSKGLVWLDDVHYNACKAIEPCACGTQFDHSFAWDNLAFDGPKTYRDLGFDVPYAHEPGSTSINGDPETNHGYDVGGSQGARTLKVSGVAWQQQPTKAKVVLNAYTTDPEMTLQVSLNGHAIGSKSFEGLVSMAIDLPAGDAVEGTNELTFTVPTGYAMITNISLILVAAAPVP